MAIKKVLAKKASAKKVVTKVVKKRRVAPTAPTAPVEASAPVPAGPVTEVFDAQMDSLEVPAGQVLLYVNGNDRGFHSAGEMTLGQFAIARAQANSIRTFSIYANGQKMDTSAANLPVSSFKKIEIVTKNARG